MPGLYGLSSVSRFYSIPAVFNAQARLYCAYALLSVVSSSIDTAVNSFCSE